MKIRLTFLIVILLTATSAPLWAQTPKIDSLRAVLKKDTANFDVLMELAQELVDLNNAEAIRYSKEAKLLSLAIGDSVKLVFASRVTGQLENRLGNIDSAIKEFTFILPIAERNECSDDLKRMLNSLATSFTYRGEFGKALEYHLKSLVLRERSQNKHEIGITLHNIASVYISSSNYEQALVYSEKCLQIKEEIQDSLDLDRLYLNFALCHGALGNYLEAKGWYDRAVAICEPNCSKYILTMTTYGMGEIYYAELNYTLAKQYFEKSLAMSIQDNAPQVHLQVHLNSLISLARLARDQGDILNLRAMLSAFESVAGTNQYPPQLEVFYELSSTYYALVGDFKKAFDFQKKSADLKESINNSRMIGKITSMQVEIAERENFQKIKAQQELLVAQNSSIEKQKIINLLLVGVALLTVSLILILFRNNQKKTVTNKILDQLVKERTSELEQNSLALQHSYNEQSIVLDRVCRELISSLATIKGLNNLASLENFVDSGAYLKAAETTLFKSIEVIKANTSSEHTKA